MSYHKNFLPLAALTSTLGSSAGGAGLFGTVGSFVSNIGGNMFNSGFTSELGARAQYLIDNPVGEWGAADDQPPDKDSWFDIFINFANDYSANFPAWFNSGVSGQQNYKVRTDYIASVFNPQSWDYVIEKVKGSRHAWHFGNLDNYKWNALMNNPSNPYANQMQAKVNNDGTGGNLGTGTSGYNPNWNQNGGSGSNGNGSGSGSQGSGTTDKDKNKNNGKDDKPNTWLIVGLVGGGVVAAALTTYLIVRKK